MSTYLVAFVVCDFKPVTSKNRGDIHVYVAEHLLPQAEYAADTAADIMAYFESYFGIPYPLPKQGTSYVRYQAAIIQRLLALLRYIVFYDA